MKPPPPRSTLFPYTTLFRSVRNRIPQEKREARGYFPVVEHDEPRSEEHTSELQSQSNLVCRLLLEKKNLLINCQHSVYGLQFISVSDLPMISYDSTLKIVIA